MFRVALVKLLLAVAIIAIATGCRVRLERDMDGNMAMEAEPSPSAPAATQAPVVSATPDPQSASVNREPDPSRSRGWLHRLPNDRRMDEVIRLLRIFVRSITSGDFGTAALALGKAGRITGTFEVQPPEGGRWVTPGIYEYGHQPRQPRRPQWLPTKERADAGFDELDELAPPEDR